MIRFTSSQYMIGSKPELDIIFTLNRTYKFDLKQDTSGLLKVFVDGKRESESQRRPADKSLKENVILYQNVSADVIATFKNLNFQTRFPITDVETISTTSAMPTTTATVETTRTMSRPESNCSLDDVHLSCFPNQLQFSLGNCSDTSGVFVSRPHDISTKQLINELSNITADQSVIFTVPSNSRRSVKRKD